VKSSPAVVLALAVALVPAILHAADDAKPNTLTPKEISDGWVLLFDGETPFGWKAIYNDNDVEPALVVEQGCLSYRHKEKLDLQTTSEFCCFELSFEYTGLDEKARLVLNGQEVELRPPDKDAWLQALVRAELKADTRVIHASFSPPGQKPSEPREIAGTMGPARTPVGFKVAAGTHLKFRSIKLKPINMKSLFNGKNLDGWSIVPGHESKFIVTDKGELNIKNGSGEIKTEGQWTDFVLQLDVFSNGKCLNSGIFFRALPGPDEFWQGYEAQIRNEWDGYSLDKGRAEKKEDRTKPHDYGTGGVYNRQPTRKVVSSDKEWFTYTVLANGNHIALWVNGYQTADYVDKKMDARSAREGRFLGKGAVSLQGHDPTTDLSFRNIRLQELPPKK
jgi:hypothetical protein